MIGFFPEPYPDELLYSICARYAQRVNFPNKQMAMRDLFGKKGFSAIVDFPTRLNTLLSSIPHHGYSADDIIGKNTLFPFYEPFLIADWAQQIQQEMKSQSDNHLNTKLAININQVKMPEFLRFCSLCVKDDRTNYGEAYWHRIHQLAGILVCPEHKCFLQNSSIRWERESSSLFHSAEEILIRQVPDYIDEKNFTHQILLDLALSARWILSQKGLSLKRGELRERYYNLLLRKGYAFYNDNVRGKKLSEEFLEFFRSDILDELGCSLKASYKTWLTRLVDKTYIDVLYHPIRHLLLLKFLQTDVKKFLTAFVRFKPFNSPPYPCLNRAAPHYLELRIKICQIKDNLTKGAKFRRPIAIFSCDCGFIYQRLGPDKSLKDSFRYDSVREYGDVWEQELRRQWANLDISLSEIARQLGTTTCLIARHAIRLNLPVNTEGTRELTGYTRYRNPRKSFLQRRDDYRAQWLEVSKEHSDKMRSELSDIANFLSLWLARNDAEWFQAHLPDNPRTYGKGDHLDWKAIDEELIEKIQVSCQEILETPGKLVRVCITEIIKRVGYKKWIEKRHLKLPKTTELIDQKLETFEDFMIRKVEWAKKEFIKERRMPTRPQFMTRAVVINTASKNSLIVQKSIDKALKNILKSL